jgi:CubicO group peptidase (beta-lactamase class C family)
MTLTRFVAINLILGLACLEQLEAEDLPSASPESVGFCSERLNYIDHFYREKTDKGEFSGIVLLIARHGKIVHESAVGYANTVSKVKMRKEAIFRWYSMTKPIGRNFGSRLFLSLQTVRYMARDHSIVDGVNTVDPSGGVGWGLGFGVIKNAAYLGTIGSDGTFYWGGAAGTAFWIDPKEDIVVVAMI